MIVPMKKISLIIKGDEKEKTLKKLRQLGIVHIEIAEGKGTRLAELREQISLLQSAMFTLGKKKNAKQERVPPAQALKLAGEILSLEEEKKKCQAEIISIHSELDRLKAWGDLDPKEIGDLEAKGIGLSFHEMSRNEYQALPDSVKTVTLGEGKASVRFLLLESDSAFDEETSSALRASRLVLPKVSTDQMKKRVFELNSKIEATVSRISFCLCYVDSLEKAVKDVENQIEFETYATGMAEEELSPETGKGVSVSYFKGYVEKDNLEGVKCAARENSWGLLVEEPCEEDNVPTKLKNNKFVSLIYPLTDFLGTVPGYFEYDISAWFLAFILVFFGIIFGDGGYGLLISAVAAIPIVLALVKKKPVSPTLLLVGLFGLSTVLWGMLTCTWFGLPAEKIPHWLQSLSVPVISNVYADKLWSLPWTSDGVGLTTAQNLQVFCFSLALIQLTVAHIMGAVRNRGKLKMLGDIGSVFQLFGIYYLVLSLVVNSRVFSFGLVIGPVPVGTVAIALIGVGFVLNFVFSNFEGSILQSILASLKNIVSVLLGVVNVFSDIVSYIRLWAVGLAGAAISATVNELAGPFFGNLIFTVVAIILLVFGHGLNMILNVLSIIVHGIRLNTLEFSSHLDMSWSGHKFKPFKEKNDLKGE